MTILTPIKNDANFCKKQEAGYCKVNMGIFAICIYRMICKNFVFTWSQHATENVNQ